MRPSQDTPPVSEGIRHAVVRELLATPALKALIKTCYEPDATEPANASAMLVKTLLWQDVDLSLSTATRLPQLVNSLVHALVTLGKELERFPEPVLQAFVADRLTEIDRDALREAAQIWSRLGMKILRPALARYNAHLTAHPDAVSAALGRLVDPLPPTDVQRALDQTLSQAADFLSTHPQVAEPLARFAFTMVWTGLQRAARSLGDRLRATR